jgi:hypothetical protein
MPLRNRVDPFGDLFAAPARGIFMGNRGGRFHRDDRTLGRRRFASRQWICCVLSFKGRQRDVWGRFYTELFFLDEPTALAAGHRPCFECRRKSAIEFAECFPGAGRSKSGRLPAPEMDAMLHRERLQYGRKRIHRIAVSALPEGGFVTLDGRDAWARRGDRLLRWSAEGYCERRPLPPGRREIRVLTPPAILHALANGYQPEWHPSAALSE